MTRDDDQDGGVIFEGASVGEAGPQFDVFWSRPAARCEIVDGCLQPIDRGYAVTLNLERRQVHLSADEARLMAVALLAGADKVDESAGRQVDA